MGKLLPSDLVSSEIIVKTARTWLGTPYHHQAAIKHVGCDCLGLIRGVYREIYGREAEKIHSYSPDWAEATGIESLLEAANRHLPERDVMARQAGDVVIFRFRRWMVAKHAAILTSQSTMIHAIQGAKVSEVNLGPWWQRHIAGVYQLTNAYINH